MVFLCVGLVVFTVSGRTVSFFERSFIDFIHDHFLPFLFEFPGIFTVSRLARSSPCLLGTLTAAYLPPSVDVQESYSSDPVVPLHSTALKHAIPCVRTS